MTHPCSSEMSSSSSSRSTNEALLQEQWGNDGWVTASIAADAAPANRASYQSGSDPSQRDALLDRYFSVIGSSPLEAIEAVTEWFDKHLDAAAVRALSVLTGVSLRSSKSTKSVRMAELLACGCPPLDVFSLREWAAGEWEARGDAPALIEAGKRRVLETERSRLPLPTVVVTPPPPGDLSDMASVMAFIAKALSAIGTGSTSSAAPPGALQTVSSLSPIEKHLNKIGSAIDQNNYVDCHQLGVQFLARLKSSERRPVASTQLGPGMYLSSVDHPVEDVSASHDPVSFGEGMVHFLHLLNKRHPSRLADVLEWWMLVQQETALSATAKVVYAKEFMFVFRAATDWVSKVGTNSNLLVRASAEAARFSTPAPPGVRPHADGLSRRERLDLKRARETSSRPTAPVQVIKRPRPPPGAAPPAPRQVLTCFSRSDPDSVACGYGPQCQFSHACASCGADHLARDCPAWDNSKLRKASKRS